MKYFIVQFRWHWECDLPDNPVDCLPHEVLANEDELKALEKAERCQQLEIIDQSELLRYKDHNSRRFNSIENTVTPCDNCSCHAICYNPDLLIEAGGINCPVFGSSYVPTQQVVLDGEVNE